MLQRFISIEWARWIYWPDWFKRCCGSSGSARKTLEKVSKLGSPRELYECLINKRPSLLLHRHIKRSQCKAYNQLKVSKIKIDFAPKRVCWKLLHNLAEQDPISTLKEETYYTVDWCISHKVSLNLTWHFTFSNAKLLHIWSDGPTSQFKNKLIAAAFPWLAERNSVDIQWQALFCNLTWERLCSHTFSHVELRAIVIAKWPKKAGTGNR